MRHEGERRMTVEVHPEGQRSSIRDGQALKPFSGEFADPACLQLCGTAPSRALLLVDPRKIPFILFPWVVRRNVVALPRIADDAGVGSVCKTRGPRDFMSNLGTGLGTFPLRHFALLPTPGTPYKAKLTDKVVQLTATLLAGDTITPPARRPSSTKRCCLPSVTMPSDEQRDLKQYATSDTDFYTLLGVTFETSQRDIDRAWRKTALKYHPDKVGADPVAKESFHLASIGYEILSDPAIKVLYDNARTARLQKQRQNELFEGKRRQMKEDLEMRERGVKRGRDEEEGDEEKLEREIRRLAEDGKRRRREREELLRKEMKDEEEAAAGAGMDAGRAESTTSHSKEPPREQTGVAEIDRTVKVRWPREGSGLSLDKDRLTALFSVFGKVENAFLLKDKKQWIGDKKEKKIMATGVIVYTSVVGAHAAVEDVKKQKGAEWAIIESVYWAANKEPDFMNGDTASEDATLSSAPSTPARSGKPADPAAFLNISNSTSTPLISSSHIKGEGLRKVPSFASFSSAAFNTPKGSPAGKGLGANSPSLEEITMIRLKNAEKRRLAAEIQRQDEEAAAAGNA